MPAASAEGVPSSDDPVFRGPFGLAVGVAEAADDAEEEDEEAEAGRRSHRGRRNRPGKHPSGGSKKAPY